MEWTDRAIILATRKHAETSALLSVLTREQGRHAGLVHGGASRRAQAVLQPGNRVAVRWRARIEDQLGALDCELEKAVAPTVLADRLRLAGVAAACAVVDSALAEREPVPRLFEAMTTLLDAIETDPEWPRRYVRWEVELLAELGYGLDLGCCVVSGATSGLAYVSPRTGRAVSQAAGAAWKDRLLALPAFLLDAATPAAPGAVAAGLTLTGYFLRRHVYADRGHQLPAARVRLAAEVTRVDPPPA